MIQTKNLTKKIASSIVLCTTLIAIMPTTAVQAIGFNPNYIISDTEMRDENTMNFQDITAFLDQKGGLNKQFGVDATDGLLKGTAQLIDDAAKRYHINPKYILTVIQKESGLVETDNPTQKQLDWATGYALCDGCKKVSPLAQKYKGLSKQIDGATAWMDWFLTNASNLSYLKQPGQTLLLNKKNSVTPANLATAALYNYTPHLDGNKLYWSIWQKWFSDGQINIQLPDGTLIKNDGTGNWALIQNGKLRPIANQSVITTRFGNQVPVILSDYEYRVLAEKNPGRPINLPDQSIVRDENGTIYLLLGNIRRPISSTEAFRLNGFNPETIEDVVAADVENYTLGDPITADDAYPTGQLIQDKTSGAVWYVESGVRHAIWDKAILVARFGNKPFLMPLSPKNIEDYKMGNPLTLPDGALARTTTDPAVYVISNGQRRLIQSADIFFGFGYQWSSVITVSDAILALQPLGEPLLLPENDSVSINQPATLTSITNPTPNQTVSAAATSGI